MQLLGDVVTLVMPNKTSEVHMASVSNSACCMVAHLEHGNQMNEVDYCCLKRDLQAVCHV